MLRQSQKTQLSLRSFKRGYLSVRQHLYVTVIAILSAASATPMPAGAQNQQSMNQMQMGQLMNVLDSQSGWQQTPISGMPSGGAVNNGVMNNASGIAMGNQGGMMPAGAMMPGSGGMRPAVMNGGFMPPGMQMPAQLQMRPQATAGENNPFSMRNLLKTFLGETPAAGGSNSANDSAALGNAQSQCQVARDQACQAEGDEGRTMYGDKGSRQSAAYSAQCHADAARAAADRATGLAYGKSSSVNDAAAQARDAAARAQAAADRARYNASTYNPTL